MPRAQAGVAAAIATTSRQVGQTLGVAVIGAVAASHTDVSPAWWTLSALGLFVLALGIVATTRRAGVSAQRTAAELNPEALLAR